MTLGGSTPTACTGSNIGKCKCVEQEGFTTYSYEQTDGDQRCFTMYVPPEGHQPMPVLLLPEQAQNPTEALQKRMEKWFGTRGVASVFVASQTGGWLGNQRMSVTVNKDNPQVCTSVDVDYGRTILTTLGSQGSALDMDAIYLAAFGTSSYFATLLSFCLSDQIRGVMVGGGSMVVPDTQYNYAKRGLGRVMDKYARFGTCDTCKFWPVYPCYEPSRPVRVCFAATNNDPYVWDQSFKRSMNDVSYKLAKDEGHIVTNIVWDTERGHTKDGLWNDWILSCLQITPPCPAGCWDEYFQKLTCNNCSATADMMLSRAPYATLEGTPGSFAASRAAPPHDRPANSICKHGA